MKYEIIKRSFFNLAVGDVLRAMIGQSLVGSIILSLCVIDYLAFFDFDESVIKTKKGIEKKAEQGKSDYKKVIKSYINRDLSKKYPANWVYALRCSLVHSYATSKAFGESPPYRGYRLTSCQPEWHLEPLPENREILALNCESFICDVIWGTWIFFSNNAGSKKIIERSSELLVLSNVDENDYKRKTYKDFNILLRELDANKPDRSRLYSDIRRKLDCLKLS